MIFFGSAPIFVPPGCQLVATGTGEYDYRIDCPPGSKAPPQLPADVKIDPIELPRPGMLLTPVQAEARSYGIWAAAVVAGLVAYRVLKGRS